MNQVKITFSSSPLLFSPPEALATSDMLRWLDLLERKVPKEASRIEDTRDAVAGLKVPKGVTKQHDGVIAIAVAVATRATARRLLMPMLDV